jgi:hypothetical protein
MTGPLNWTSNSTGALVRAAQDRDRDLINIKDFGAAVDGTTHDEVAIGNALASLVNQQAVWFPGGSTPITWGSVQGTTPTTPVLFKCDGTQSGGSTILQAYNRNNKGDVFESFSGGVKFFAKRSAEPNSGGVVRIEYTNSNSGGTQGFVGAPLNVVAADNTGAVLSTLGINVSFNSNSNQTAGGWPQNVGINASVKKNGVAWTNALHGSVDDTQNLPSSTGGTGVAIETRLTSNGVDDAFNGQMYGTVGTRIGYHMSLSEYSSSGALPCEIAVGFWISGTTNAIIKSAYSLANSVRGYQALDTRGAAVPSGYTDPYAGVRMLAGQIVDFNGGPALNSNAGASLQYTTTGGNRLRYNVGTTEVFSISDVGAVTLAADPAAALGAATKQYVDNHVAQPGTATPVMDGTAVVGVSLLYARQDHVHPTNTALAPVASPTFTGTVSLPGTIDATGATGFTFVGASGVTSMHVDDPGVGHSGLNWTYTSANNLWTLAGTPGGVNFLASGAFTATTLRTTSTVGPTWTSGAGAPSATQPVGSLYSNTTGAVGATLYVSRGGGTWNAVAGV